MATKTFEELKQMAIQIRDEKTNKQNTATRIGTQMLEHLNKLEQDFLDKDTTEGKFSELESKQGIYNVDANASLSSGQFYTASTARNAVPTSVRKLGLIITYKTNATTSVTEQFIGSAVSGWGNDSNWKNVGSESGNKILTWDTDVATTRKKVPFKERKYGLIITYKNGDGQSVNEQYVSIYFDDTNWVKDTNWSKIPNPFDITKAEWKIPTPDGEYYIEPTEDKSGQGYFDSNGDFVELTIKNSYGGIYDLTSLKNEKLSVYLDAGGSTFIVVVDSNGQVVEKSHKKPFEFVVTEEMAELRALGYAVDGRAGVYVRKTNSNIELYNLDYYIPLSSGYYTTETARMAVPSNIRKKGLIITYKTDATTIVTEQFKGELPKEHSEWIYKDTNWDKIAYQSQITEIEEQVTKVDSKIPKPDGYMLIEPTEDKSGQGYFDSNGDFVELEIKNSYGGIYDLTSLKNEKIKVYLNAGALAFVVIVDSEGTVVKKTQTVNNPFEFIVTEEMAELRAVGYAIEERAGVYINIRFTQASDEDVTPYIEKYDQYKGSNFVLFSDSIGAGYNSEKKWCDLLAESLSMNMYNYSVSGYQTSDMLNKIDNAIDDAGLVIMAGGTNDWALGNIALGEMYSSKDGEYIPNKDTSTFYGRINSCCEKLLSKYPTAKIILLTPTHRKTYKEQYASDRFPNSRGLYLYQYVDAIIESCNFYSIQVINMYAESGLNPNIDAVANAYFNHEDGEKPDLLHPDANGHVRYAEFLLSKIL